MTLQPIEPAGAELVRYRFACGCLVDWVTTDPSRPAPTHRHDWIPIGVELAAEVVYVVSL